MKLTPAVTVSFKNERLAWVSVRRLVPRPIRTISWPPRVSVGACRVWAMVRPYPFGRLCYPPTPAPRAGLLRLWGLFAGPGAGEAREGAPRAVVGQALDEPEDRTLDQ